MLIVVIVEILNVLEFVHGFFLFRQKRNSTILPRSRTSINFFFYQKRYIFVIPLFYFFFSITNEKKN